MFIEKIDVLLEGLRGGPFDEPARMLQMALAKGAEVRFPSEALSSLELRNTYGVRRKHLQGAKRLMPGFDMTADLFMESPEGNWLLVGVDAGSLGGVVVVSEKDRKAVACFAYLDPSTPTVG